MYPESRPRHTASQLVRAVVLFVATFLTTCTMGANMALKFEANQPPFDIVDDFRFFATAFSNPGLLVYGLPFSLTLLAILFAHEMGHYLTCVYYRIDASPPYFLPAPTVAGTFGAFIRLRSPVYSMSQLFDVGVAGPLAGFALIIPALAIGVAYSRVIPGLASQGDLVMGTPPFLRVLELWLFPGVAVSDISLHPVARAAWVGMFATAMNLLPIGQLDGGHMLYAAFSRGYKQLSRLFALLLLPMGYFWLGWIGWALFFLITGRKRPTIYDTSPLDGRRKVLGILAAIILLGCFCVQPFSEAAVAP